MTVEDKQLEVKIGETGSEETERSKRPHGGFSMMTSGRRLNADEEKEMELEQRLKNEVKELQVPHDSTCRVMHCLQLRSSTKTVG